MLNRLAVLFSFIAVSVSLSPNALARGGGMVGNGGDSILQEFNLRGVQMAAFLKAEPVIAQRYGVDPIDFSETVKTTKLVGKDHLNLMGVEVDAINYPEQALIEVSRTRWDLNSSRADSFFVQRRIVLHEYLWVYGIDDTNYVVSNPIIAELEKEVGFSLTLISRQCSIRNIVPSC